MMMMVNLCVGSGCVAIESSENSEVLLGAVVLTHKQLTTIGIFTKPCMAHILHSMIVNEHAFYYYHTKAWPLLSGGNRLTASLSCNINGHCHTQVSE